DFGLVLDFDRPGRPLGLWQFLEIGERFFEDAAHHVGVVVIAIAEQLAVGGEDVDALPCRAALALAWALIGDLAEEFTLGVLLAALIPVVAGHGHKLLLGHADHFGVGECGHTAHDAVVSGTAERMAVHLPKENRFAL